MATKQKLTLSQKLQLSRRSNIVSLIDEGVFLRIYNQSAFVLVSTLGINFKLNFCEIDTYKPLQFIYCAFPKKTLFKRFPNAIKTPWGYELHGNYGYTDYQNWFSFVWTQNQNINSNHGLIKNMSPRAEST